MISFHFILLRKTKKAAQRKMRKKSFIVVRCLQCNFAIFFAVRRLVSGRVLCEGQAVAIRLSASQPVRQAVSLWVHDANIIRITNEILVDSKTNNNNKYNNNCAAVAADFASETL